VVDFSENFVFHLVLCCSRSLCDLLDLSVSFILFFSVRVSAGNRLHFSHGPVRLFVISALAVSTKISFFFCSEHRGQISSFVGIHYGPV
jgi:hypothetical protein